MMTDPRRPPSAELSWEKLDAIEQRGSYFVEPADAGEHMRLLCRTIREQAAEIEQLREIVAGIELRAEVRRGEGEE